jgi:hypothetical protein
MTYMQMFCGTSSKWFKEGLVFFRKTVAKTHNNFPDCMCKSHTYGHVTSISKRCDHESVNANGHSMTFGVAATPQGNQY